MWQNWREQKSHDSLLHSQALPIIRFHCKTRFSISKGDTGCFFILKELAFQGLYVFRHIYKVQIKTTWFCVLTKCYFPGMTTSGLTELKLKQAPNICVRPLQFKRHNLRGVQGRDRYRILFFFLYTGTLIHCGFDNTCVKLRALLK